MPKYEIEIKEVQDNSGCGSILAVVIILFILSAMCSK